MLLLEIFATVLMVLLMAALARMAGGGKLIPMPPNAEKLPEFLFAAAFGMASYLAVPSLTLAAASLAWSFLWMETGHGTAFHMGRRPDIAQSGRRQFLNLPIDALCKALRMPLGGRFYCWAFMGLKGALIGLPVFPLGLWLGLLWPAGYEVGRLMVDYKICKDGRWCEYLSGGGAGMVVAFAILG